MAGGAVLISLQGAMVDGLGVELSYLLPLGCFVVIAGFAAASCRTASL